MKNNTSIGHLSLRQKLLFSLPLFLILSSLTGCSSTPSVIDENEKNPGIDDISHFSSIKKNDLKSPTKGTLSQQQELPASNVSSEGSISNEVTSTEPTINAEDELANFNPEAAEDDVDNSTNKEIPAEDIEHNAPLTQEDAISNNVAVADEPTPSNDDITNLPNSIGNQSKVTSKDLFTGLEKYSDDSTNNENNNKNDINCNQIASKFKSFNALTTYIAQCNWSLPLVLKMNNIRNPSAFTHNKIFLFPSALYKISDEEFKESEEANKAPSTSCDDYTAEITSVNDIAGIAKQCKWNTHQILTINNIQKRLLIKQNFYTIILPPALEKLKEVQRRKKLWNRDMLLKAAAKLSLASVDTKPQKETQDSILNTPKWCNKAYYVTRGNKQTIQSLADQCGFHAEALATLNQTPRYKPLINKKVILPTAFNAKVKKKNYKIPLDPNKCSQKTYRVEYGMSIGKISSTCQWNYKYLLQLNELHTHSLLEINQKLLLPSYLTTKLPASTKANNKKKTPTLKTINTPVNKKATVNYATVCNQNGYRFGIKDNLFTLAKSCQWDITRLTAINANQLSKVVEKEQSLLFPNVIDAVILAKKTQTKRKAKARQAIGSINNVTQFLKVCTNKKIKLEANDTNIKSLAKLCRLNPVVLKKLNSTLATRNNTHITLPPALFNNFGKINKWTMPLDNNDYTVITPQENEPSNFLFTVTNPRALVRNVQKGIIINVHRSSPNTYKVFIKHADGYVSVYNGLSNVFKEAGSFIEKDENFAEISKTSNSLGYQLFKNHTATSFIKI